MLQHMHYKTTPHEPGCCEGPPVCRAGCFGFDKPENRIFRVMLRMMPDWLEKDVVTEDVPGLMRNILVTL